MTANRYSDEEAKRARARLRALTPEQYEAELLDAMRMETRHRYGPPEAPVKVAEVRLEGAYPETQLVVVLLDPARPDCRFGWASSIWRDSLLPMNPSGAAGSKDLGMFEWLDLRWDHFRSLACEPGELTWIMSPRRRRATRPPQALEAEQLIYNDDRRLRPGDSDWRPETWGPIDVPPGTLPPDRPGLG